MNGNDSVFSKEKEVRVSPMVGIDITTAIKEAIVMSKSHGVKVTFNFNGQEVAVDQSSTVEKAYKDWCDKMKQARIEYEKSPEYAASQRRAEMSRQSAQNNLDRLMSVIDTIDFSNLEQALPFLSQIIKHGDHVGVSYDWRKVNEILTANGYFKNMNCNTETYKIDENDKDAVGKWLVGQYMSCAHPAIGHHMEQWIEKFITPKMEQGKASKTM